LLILVLLQATGCNTEYRTKKSDADIIEIAYQYLSENTRKTIVDWKNAEVQEDNDSVGYLVANQNGVVSTKGKDTYIITFKTNSHYALGPVMVFMDRNTYKIIGVGLRD
jgi:hypothetical protein